MKIINVIIAVLVAATISFFGGWSMGYSMSTFDVAEYQYQRGLADGHTLAVDEVERICGEVGQ